MSKYDIIVIGGGHNGLTNATMLAKGGKTAFDESLKIGNLEQAEKYAQSNSDRTLLSILQAKTSLQEQYKTAIEEKDEDMLKELQKYALDGE